MSFPLTRPAEASSAPLPLYARIGFRERSSCFVVVFITQPVIGKLSQVGAERVVGTILGGVLGFCVFEIGEKFWTQRSVAMVTKDVAGRRACNTNSCPCM